MDKEKGVLPVVIAGASILGLSAVLCVMILGNALVRSGELKVRAGELKLKAKEVESKKDYEMKTDHKFNRCLAIAMSESRQSGKPITVQEAKEICSNLETNK